MKLLFAKEPQQGITAWAFIALSIALMVADYRYHQFEVLRKYLSLGSYPIHWAVNGPLRLWEGIKQYTQTYQELQADNEKLRDEQVMQNARMQKWMAIDAENTRLRALLQSSPRVGERLFVAEIIQASSDPLVHRIVLDKGEKDGVMLGQPVIDANGVIGEVIEVHAGRSRIILLTDASYGIAVENVRTGIRGIASGTGSMHALKLQYVASTVDLAVGDVLVTSGLDGRYPPGYLVGTIRSIDVDPSGSFSNVQVTPSSNVEHSRQVLLVERLGKGQ